MEALLNYTLKVSIALLALHLFYFLILRGQNSFRFNRAYLLLAPIIALRLPFIQWPAILSPDAAVSEMLQAVQLGEVVVTAYQPEAAAATAATATWLSLLTAFYLLGVAFVLFKLVRQLWQIRQLKAQAILARQAEGIKVYHLNSPYPAFAFGKSIFLSQQQEQLHPQEREQVLAHELAHVKYGHTWDVILYELLSAILWFHPAVWLLKQELRDVHEYQADAAVVTRHQTQKYTSLLSREALLSMGLPVGSYFTKPQVLKRLQMLQLQGHKPGWVRPLLAAPLLLALAFLLARQQATAENQSITADSGTSIDALPAVSISDFEATTPSGERPYTYVEQMPTFKGGDVEMMKFLGKNIRYPEAAQEAGVEGLVVLSFVVDRDGSLSNFQVVKSLGQGTDEEALRVVESMNGSWQPGRQNGVPVPVRYTLPVRFAIK
ncbi:M56 family metallopeptidase [Pontibacter chinhatensis]|uniref:Outer membrane transport energization protein TonB n=1 Tax=Pontibacter chinhatensis TaxID=1436961 RepID=A0A1I2QTK5_9BACT|nr:M56 family metallopeptidase [Pontibacter chinhatensis]SFG31360.1 outer membrane transport energization protein TonB [Pontibacter chinhatensis]